MARQLLPVGADAERAVGIESKRCFLRGRRARGAPRRFVPAKAQASGEMLGRTLAGSADRETSARLALLCNLGV